MLLKLCCETAKYRDYLNRLLNSTGGIKLLKSNAIRNNRYLALVVLYELCIGQGVSDSKCSKTLRKAINDIKKIINKEVYILFFFLNGCYMLKNF